MTCLFDIPDIWKPEVNKFLEFLAKELPNTTNADRANIAYAVLNINSNSLQKDNTSEVTFESLKNIYRKNTITLDTNKNEDTLFYPDLGNNDRTIEYTSKGKTKQTYTIRKENGEYHIYNSEGKEVFKGDSKDRRRIFANLAVQEKRAVVVDYNNSKYVVNKRGDIISVQTGDRMKWGDENGDKKNVLSIANDKFKAIEATREKVKNTNTEIIKTLGNDENAKEEIKDAVKVAKEGLSFEEAIATQKSIFSKEEQAQIKKALDGKNLQVMSVSRRTDPAFFSKEIIQFLEQNSKKSFEDPTRVNVIELWSKHDGIPIQNILEACKKYKVAPMVSFSITGLGGTSLEKGVMKHDDLLDRLEQLINVGALNPITTTIRIDPILVGETNLEDIKHIVARGKAMGIKKYVTSLVQSYGYTEGTPFDRKVVSGINKALASEGRTYDWDKYYGRRNGKIEFKPKQQYINEVGKVLLELNNDPEITIQTCSFFIEGLKASACLDPLIIERITGIDVTRPDGTYDRDTSRPDCMCYGAHSDLFKTNEKKCFSSCAYCYAAHSGDSNLDYYNEDGTLKDNSYTRVNQNNTEELDTLPDYTLSNQQNNNTISNNESIPTVDTVTETVEQSLSIEEIDSTLDDLLKHTAETTKEIKKDPYHQIHSVFTYEERVKAAKTLSLLTRGFLTSYIKESKNKANEVLKNSSSSLEEQAKALDTLALYKGSTNPYKAALQELGMNNYIKELKIRLESRAAESRTEESRQFYSNALKYFDVLFQEAIPHMTRDFGVTFELSIKDSLEEEELEEESQSGENFDVNTDYSGFDIKSKDPMSSPTLEIKSLLSLLLKRDERGNIVVDRLTELPECENGSHVLMVLQTEMSKALTYPSDWAIKQQDGSYIFPALDRLGEKYPWLQELKNKIRNNPKLVAQLYGILRRDLNKYTVISNGIASVINNPTYNESIIAEATRRIDDNEVLQEESFYNTVVNGTRKYNTALINKVKTKIQYSTLTLDDVKYYLRALGIDLPERAYKGVNEGELIRVFSSQFPMVINNMISINRGSSFANTLRNVQSQVNVSTFIDNILNVIGYIPGDALNYTFSANGKKYANFSAPSFLSTLLRNLTNPNIEERRKWVEENYEKYVSYTASSNLNTTAFTGDWLRVQKIGGLDLLDAEHLLSVEGKDYQEWKKDDITTAALTMYYKGKTIMSPSGKALKTSYYLCPIFADSSNAVFLSNIRYTAKNKEELLNKMTSRFTGIALADIATRDDIIKRKDKFSPIAAYDKNGDSFFFLPELDEEDNGNFYAKVCEMRNEGKSVREVNNYIKEHVRNVLENYIESSFPEAATYLLQGQTNEEKQLEWETFLLNDMYARANILQLTINSGAFYKNDNGITLQKRFKEVIGNGQKLFTGSKYGKEKSKFIVFEDNIMTSVSAADMYAVIDKALNEKRISKEEAASMKASALEINATDAQAFRTLPSLRSFKDMAGEWDEEVHGAAYNRILNGQWTKNDLDVIYGIIKPFFYGFTEKQSANGKIKVGVQLKNSEFPLLAMYPIIAGALNHSIELKALNEFMVENDIDSAQSESAIKTGCQSKVSLHYNSKRVEALIQSNPEYKNLKDYKDLKFYLDDKFIKGKISGEDYNAELEKVRFKSVDEVKAYLNAACFNNGEINPDVVTEIDNDDYCLQIPTPNHLRDSEVILGSQFKNIIISDLPSDLKANVGGKEYSSKEIVDEYLDTLSAQMEKGYNEVASIFGNIEQLSNILLDLVRGNDKYGNEVLEAFTLVTDENGEKHFKTPLNSPTIRPIAEQLMLSLLKNRVTKQRVTGATPYVVAGVGLSKELRVLHDKNGALIGAECYMPAYTKKFFEGYLKPQSNGYVLDIDKIKKEDPSLLEMVGYRIPTEDKYSSVPLIIKGFMPESNGAIIMVPPDINLFTGGDHDIDKLFLHLPATKLVKNSLTKEELNSIITKCQERGLNPNPSAIKNTINYLYDGGEANTDLAVLLKNEFPNVIRDLNTSKVKRVQYDPSKAKTAQSKEALSNHLLDIELAIMKDPNVTVQMEGHNNFDKAADAANRMKIRNNSMLLEKFQKQFGKGNLYKATNKEISDFLSSTTDRHCTLGLDTFAQFHAQNMLGKLAIGIAAITNTLSHKYERINIIVDRIIRFMWEENKASGKTFTLSNTTTQDPEGGEILKSKNTANNSAASVDNTKNPTLNDINYLPKFAGTQGLLLRMGVPYKLTTVIMQHPLFDKETGEVNNSILKNVYKNIKMNEYYTFLDNTILSPEKVELLMSKNDINFNFLVANLYMAAKELRSKDSCLKADTVNGAVSNTLAGAATQVKQMENILSESRPSYFSGYSNVLDKLQHVKTGYELGIKSYKDLVKPYLKSKDEAADTIEDILDILCENGSMSESARSYFYSKVTEQKLKTLPIFKDDRKDFFTKDFVNWFAKHKNDPVYAGNSLIKHLVIKDNNILLPRSSERDVTVRNTYVSSLEVLIDSPTTRKMALGLLGHAWHTNKLQYSPEGYSQYFSPTFFTFIEGYNKALNAPYNGDVLQLFRDVVENYTYAFNIIETKRNPSELKLPNGTFCLVVDASDTKAKVPLYLVVKDSSMQKVIDLGEIYYTSSFSYSPHKFLTLTKPMEERYSVEYGEINIGNFCK